MHINSFDYDIQTEFKYSNYFLLKSYLVDVDTKSDLYFDFLQFIYESFLFYSIETYVKSRGLVLAYPPLYTCIVAKYIIYLYSLRNR